MKLTAAFLSLALAAGSGVALAGSGKAPDGLVRLQQALELTDEQVEEIRRIRENGGTREDVDAVLTEEQRAKADKMRKSRAGKGGPHGGDRLTRMQQHLDLSDEQVAQMREIRENGGTREEMHAVLTDDQRAQLDQMRQRHGGMGKGRHGE